MNEDMKSFYRFLFRTSFCCMACDGHIDAREVEEIRAIARTTPYFREIDVERELRDLIDGVKSEGRRIFKHYLDDLKQRELNPVQELLLIEVALRVIYIDERVDPNEVRFLRLLRSKLKVPSEIVMQRFGAVDLLFGPSEKSEMSVESESGDSEFLNESPTQETFASMRVDLDSLPSEKPSA